MEKNNLRKACEEQLFHSIHAIIKSLVDIYHPVGKQSQSLIDEGVGHFL